MFISNHTHRVSSRNNLEWDKCGHQLNRGYGGLGLEKIIVLIIQVIF
jgi:hypothetical protein